MEDKLSYENALTKRFLYKVTEDGIIYPQYETFPEIYGKVLNYFIGIYGTPSKVQQVIDDINEHRKRKNNKEFLGSNDTTFLVDNDSTTFYTEFVSEQPPITMSTNDALDFFKRYKDWIVKFASGEIVGLTQTWPHKYRVVRTSNDPIVVEANRDVLLKGNFFIKASMSLSETADIINNQTNLDLKKDESGYYEEIPAYSNGINLVEFALLGIPNKEYQMPTEKYDCFNFIIRDNNKHVSKEWIDYGKNIMSTLKMNTKLECFE